jgi:hypothetical protein
MTHTPSIKTKVYLATSYSFVSGSGKGTALEQRSSSAGKFVNKIISRWKEYIRYKRVTKVAAHWLTQGYNIFSPITHSHPIGRMVPDRLNTHSMWLGLDFAWIDCCDELWVLMQDGWRQSYGVSKEIEYALEKGMPVRYVAENNYMYLDYNQMHAVCPR